MSSGGELRDATEARLRLGGVVARIEGLYAALLRTRRPDRRGQLLAELSEAGARLAAEAAPEGLAASASWPLSRRERRIRAAERGARWISTRCR
ncbi:hypothetical protein [Streptacidiphilus sp. MAP12-20]|uniref:hypothetical protein n=1 Tax=Streptacidiphilus sp. MAP12-20 TaxID=3156299 RepID=UPI0035126EF8